MVVGLFFLVLAALLLVAGLRRRRRDLAVARHWHATVGTVVSNKTVGFRSYLPVVQFNAADGQLIQFTSNIGANRRDGHSFLQTPWYEPGEIVPVIYDPQNPQSARIRRGFIFWGTSIALIGGGLLCLLIGATRLAQHLFG